MLIHSVKKILRIFLGLSLMISILTACAPAAISETVLPAETNLPASETPTLEPSLTPTQTSSQTFTLTFTVTDTPLPSETPTPSISPTPVTLRGMVLQKANCRYGPGAAYLYKYGLVAGSNLEIIGRNEIGDWIMVRAIGGNNPCWVNADLMEVKGEVMSLSLNSFPLPATQFYYPPKGVSANRVGNEVTVFWSRVPMTVDKDRGYLLELWLCREGKIVFTPVHSDATAEMVIDESGCSEPSHGRIYTAEKHGYTHYVEIQWPQFDGTTQPSATP
jgi:hypothetical protein